MIRDGYGPKKKGCGHKDHTPGHQKKELRVLFSRVALCSNQGEILSGFVGQYYFNPLCGLGLKTWGTGFRPVNTCWNPR